MSTPPDEPWIMPTAELAEPRKRRAGLFVVPVLALLLLCCGGGWAIRSAFTGKKSDEAGPVLMVPVTSTPASRPSPTPSTLPPPTTKATPKKTLSPTLKAATKTPRTTKPTTKKPTTAPTATGIVQQDVRQGALCSPLGAFGMTAAGRLEHCGPSLDDPRDRWRRLT